MNAPTDYQPDAADLASLQRVLALHNQYPDKDADQLVDQLIQNCCLHVASQSAATAGLAVLPTLSMVAAFAVGAIANNLTNTQQQQTELLLDIATTYRYRFHPNEKQSYMAVALGLPTGKQPRQGAQQSQSAAEQLLAKGGQQLANQATQRLARSTVGKRLPVVNVTKAVGANLLMTYTAGQRAKAYIKTGPASVGTLEQSLGAALRGDGLKLSAWTQTALATTMADLSDTLMAGFDQGAQEVGRAAGRATRKFLTFWRNATTPKQD